MSSTLDARNNFLDGISNMNEIIEQIALGPQEEVIGLIDNLNQRWNTDFRCTPTFRWQPGFYKKLKENSGRISNINIQKNKVSTYKNQIQNGRWSIDQFLTKIDEIDTKLYFLRNSGICFQDNTDDVNRVLAEYKEKIEETMVSAMELYPTMNLSVYHGLHVNGYHNSRSYNGTNHAISFHIYIENVTMNINIGGESVAVPMGDLDIMICVDLIKNVMNRIRNVRITQGAQGGGHTNPWNGAIFHPQEPEILFPYISQERWNRDQMQVAFSEGQNTRSGFSNVCFGNFDSEIREAAWTGDIIALFTYLDSWTKNFNVGRTGPLNGYDKMFHGVWPEMTTEVWESTGNMNSTSRMDSCKYANVLNADAPIQENSYCDRYGCTLRNDCLAYRAMYMPPEPIEDDEGAIASDDRTLSEIELLRMYEGVNTINIRS